MSGRITVQSLKTYTGVTDVQLALQCTDEHLSHLAPKVPNWFTLAVTLGLEEYERNGIKVNLDLDYLQKTVEVLKVWKRKMGREATYLRMVKGCLEMSNALLAGDVCTLAKSATSDPNSLEGWFREVGLMDRDIDILTSEGYATKQAFCLLSFSELDNMGLTSGGKKLLTKHIQANTISPAPVPTPAQSSEYLDTSSHLKDLFSQTFEASNKWFNIGLQLNLPKHVLDGISRNTRLHDDGDYYREMLTCWMQTGEAKIKDLVDALKGPTVGLLDVARKVQ